MDQPPKYSDDEIRATLHHLLEELPILLSQFDRRGFWAPGGADELRQRVAAAALGSLQQFEPSGELQASLRRWLAGIARNTHGTLAREAYKAVEAVEDAILEQARAENISPSRLMAKEEAIATLQACLMKLADAEQTMLIRLYVERRTAAQVAADLGLTVDQLDHRIRRVKRTLRDCWGSSGAYRFVAGGA